MDTDWPNRSPRRDGYRLRDAGVLETTWLPPGLRTLRPLAAVIVSRLPIRESREFARTLSSVLSARGHRVRSCRARWYQERYRATKDPRVAELFRERRAITFADLLRFGFGLIATAIFAPTASLAARSGSAERCA